ncbi:MAG: hypothetical protein ACREON_05605, partial [Gemmatimonadaceae bacterium]
MPHRRWTVLVVPHGSAESRTFSVTARGLGALKIVLAVLLFLATVGVGLSTMLFSRAGLMIGSAEAEAERARALQRQLTHLNDTLEVIRSRDAQIR